MGPTDGTATWRLNLARPVEFGRSIDHSSLQLADVLAGVASEVYGPAYRNRLAPLKELMERHLHPNHILPRDDGPLDLSELMAWVSSL